MKCLDQILEPSLCISNPKVHIIFSMICMALFLYKPNIKNQYVLYGVLFLIFNVAYVAMAWYDYYFNCDLLPLKKGKY